MNLEPIKRRQLTLFLPESNSSDIEKCRAKFNIEQFKIIRAHITLCREHEIDQLEKVKHYLENLNFTSFYLELGKPIRFSGDKGVLISVFGNDELFQKLRTHILSGIIEYPETHEPHITIMHPRNSTCTDEIFDTILNLTFPTKLRFDKISLIEQTLGEKWNVLEEYKLEN